MIAFQVSVVKPSANRFGIERRRAHEREHAPRPDVHEDRPAGLVAEAVVKSALHSHVERDAQRPSVIRLGLDARVADLPAERVDRHELPAAIPAQPSVERALDAGLADDVPGQKFFRARQLGLVHLRDVADRMGHHLTLGIVATRRLTHADGREQLAPSLDVGELDQAGVLLQLDLLEQRPTGHGVEPVLQILQRNRQDRCEALQLRFEVAPVLASHPQRQGRPSGGHDGVGAVVDHPPCGRDLDPAHAVVLRQDRVLLAVDALQVPEVQHEGGEHDGAGNVDGQDPPLQPAADQVVLELPSFAIVHQRNRPRSRRPRNRSIAPNTISARTPVVPARISNSAQQPGP